MFSRILQFFGYEKAVGASVLGGVSGATTSERPSPANVKKFLARYADQAWVFICIAILQTKLAGVPIKIYKRPTAGKPAEELPDHPLKALLDKANPFMNGYSLIEGTMGFLGLSGDSYWVLDEFLNGLPSAIYPIDPSKVKILANKDKFITGYVYEPMPGVSPIFFQPEEIIHFKTWNPLDPFHGMPPLAAARDQADLIMSADRYNKAFFENSAEPGGVLLSDQPLDENSFKRIQVAWKKMHQGERKAYKTAILDGGLKWQDVTKSHRDMQFVDLKHMSREDVLGVYRIPPAMAGIYTDAKYDNADMQRRTFWQDTMTAWVRLFEGAINAGLIQPYDQTVFAAFDLSSVPELQEDKQQKAQEDEILTRSGIKTINEIRGERKLPKVAWGDTWNAPVGLMPIDQPRGQQDTPPEPAPAPKDPPKPGKSKSFLLREAAWLDFKGLTERQEMGWRGGLARLFNLQEREVKDALRRMWEKKATQARLDPQGGKVKQAIDAIIFNGVEGRSMFRKEGRKLMQTTLFQSAASQAARHSMGALDLTNPRVARWLDEKAYKFADEVNDTTETALRAQLEAAVKNGESVSEAAKRIEDLFDAARGWRSERIARTEVVSASNKGAVELYVQNGVQRVEWLTARDNDVRDSHQIDGQARNVGDKFSNGLEFPGDPQGTADEIINCRCAIAPAAPKED